MQMLSNDLEPFFLHPKRGQILRPPAAWVVPSEKIPKTAEALAQLYLVPTRARKARSRSAQIGARRLGGKGVFPCIFSTPEMDQCCEIVILEHERIRKTGGLYLSAAACYSEDLAQALSFIVTPSGRAKSNLKRLGVDVFHGIYVVERISAPPSLRPRSPQLTQFRKILASLGCLGRNLFLIRFDDAARLDEKRFFEEIGFISVPSSPWFAYLKPFRNQQPPAAKSWRPAADPDL